MFLTSANGTITEIFLDLSRKQTNIEPEVAKVLYENRSKLYEKFERKYNDKISR